ncbi:FAD-binding protein [Nitrospina watsonii]|uniref:L-aspartate oxidase n=1 Tax=Nitrospina watsonii TaxID=1323948 RepID=A0ABN8VYQ2_9BACT|nr:FAD-binding protein [Nitrospina watsonii]CAI2718882.1 L-aspartate oxidase [Nitrospina watsonii]
MTLDWAADSIEKVKRSRTDRLNQTFPEMDEQDAEALIRAHHPDYVGAERPVRVGPNADTGHFPLELAALLEADSPLPAGFTPQTDLETDVLIIGGGGAGVAAALGLENSGLSVHLATKLRLGDSNTVMAEGGIQAALGKDDSARRHFADAYVGGHGKNNPELLRILCESGPPSIQWLVRLGVMFDPDGNGMFRLKPGGGTSVPRVLACRDYTGLEIMRVLRDAVMTGGTQLLENQAAVELLDDGNGQVTGAVLWNTETRQLTTVSARAVILATGGSGQLRFQGFPTSNHLGATGDGLVLAYRQGCQLVHLSSYQYHPSGASYPEAVAGQLVTEAIRSSGAQLLNAHGERFIDEMTYRDRVAAAIIKEAAEGRAVETPHGRKGVWLDTPMIDLLKGEGTLAKQFPGLIHRFKRYSIDPAEQPVLVYPTLHYQNGGICIDDRCRTECPGLWAAGEVTGGLHGTNRLMGNSLLDIIVFGRRAAESVQDELPERRAVTLTALTQFRDALKALPDAPAQTAPQLYPTVSQLKFATAAAAETATEPKAGNASFNPSEPPDPFASR